MEELHGSFLSAFLLTLFAGLSTGIGSFISVFAKREHKGFLSLGLGFSAGVMIYVSFMELLFESKGLLESSVGGTAAPVFRIAGFFGGMLVAFLIDRAVPESSNPHECGHETIDDIKECCEECDEHHEHRRQVQAKGLAEAKLARMGMFAAIAIAIHNFPEGFAVFAAALKEPALGVSIAVAIAIHNIPEGIAVSIPIYYATGSRAKAFAYSFLSGFAEPLGAVIGYLVLKPFLGDLTFGVILAAVAGIMVYISFDELLPAARRYGKGHVALIGLAAGMLVMSLALDFMGHGH